MITNNFEMIIENIINGTTYDEIGSFPGDVNQISVFDPEYRIIQSKKRLDEVIANYRNEQYCCEMMQQLLASANGNASYIVEIPEIFGRLKEWENFETVTVSGNLVPMTLIAYKVEAGQICGSVESCFCIWDDRATGKENLNRLYMRHLTEITVKIAREKFCPVGVIGKGDFTKPMRKIFADQFGFMLK